MVYKTLKFLLNMSEIIKVSFIIFIFGALEQFEKWRQNHEIQKDSMNKGRRELYHHLSA